MKIKILKEYKFLRGFDNDVDLSTTKLVKGAIVDTVEDEVPDIDVQWLIDNGFAEEVKESGWWKPKLGDIYYVAYPDGLIASCTWDGCTVDLNRFLNGAVFKTKEATKRWRDYLKAVTTVRQDKGVLTSKEVESTERSSGNVWCIAYTFDSGLLAHTCPLDEMLPQTGAIYFNSLGHANDSLSNHPDEWKIIANYDWSRE